MCLLGHCLQLAILVLCDQRLDHLVDLPVEERLQLVQSIADPVVGDAPLGEIVGANALAPIPGATWLRLAWAYWAACSSCFCSKSLARSTRMAFSLFFSWDFSSWQVTHDPGGEMGDPHGGVGWYDALAPVA